MSGDRLTLLTHPHVLLYGHNTMLVQISVGNNCQVSILVDRLFPFLNSFQLILSNPVVDASRTVIDGESSWT